MCVPPAFPRPARGGLIFAPSARDLTNDETPFFGNTQEANRSEWHYYSSLTYMGLYLWLGVKTGGDKKSVSQPEWPGVLSSHLVSSSNAYEMGGAGMTMEYREQF